MKAAVLARGGEGSTACLGERGWRHWKTPHQSLRLLGEAGCDLYFVREGMAEVEDQLLGLPQLESSNRLFALSEGPVEQDP